MKKRLLALASILCLIATVAYATTTTHYSYVLPVQGGSANVWGSLLNTIFNTIDTNIWTAAGGTTISVNAPASSGSNITLTNPIANVQNISFTGGGKSLILPAMNATASVVPGGTFYVNNVGSFDFEIFAQDGSTAVVTSLPAGQSVAIQLLSGATANGTFKIYTTIPSAPPIPVATGGTGAATISVNAVILGNGTSAIQTVAPGTSGNLLTSNGTTWTSAASSVAAVPTGAMIIWTSTSCPSGYLETNGAAVAQATYPALYAILGTTFGSNGGGNFTLPDMRGYFPRGWADAGSIDSGRVFGSTQTDAIKSHSVTVGITDPGHVHTYAAGTGTGGNFAVNGNNGTGITSNANTSAATTGITASGSYSGATETRSINLALMFCIKT